MVKSIYKFRNKQGIIVGYRLKDDTGNTRDVKASILKDFIRQGKVKIANLTLTSDNRLVDTDGTVKEPVVTRAVKTCNKVEPVKPVVRQVNKVVPAVTENNRESKRLIEQDKKYNDREIDLMIHRLESKGCKRISDICVPAYEVKDDTVLIFLKSNISVLNNRLTSDNLKGKTIVVIGGSGLKSCRSLFFDCNAAVIDCTHLDTSNVENMSSMFSCSKAYEIKINNLDTHNVKRMNDMFNNCKVKSIDLSNFDTSNVEDMDSMFWACKTRLIGLNRLNTKNLRTMKTMFMYAVIPEIDLTGLNFDNMEDCSNVFMRCSGVIKTDNYWLNLQKSSR